MKTPGLDKVIEMAESDVNTDWFAMDGPAARGELADLKTEVEGLRADKARLDWLEPMLKGVGMDRKEWPLVDVDSGTVYACNFGEGGSVYLRDAIDAAMKEDGR